MTCEEDADEPPTVKYEKFWKLPCKLNKDVSHINMGVSTSLVSQVSLLLQRRGPCLFHPTIAMAVPGG